MAENRLAEVGMSPWSSKLVRFASVGAVGTAAHYAFVIMAVSGLGLSPGASAAAGAFIGAVVNYALSRAVVFGRQLSHAHTMPRFVVMAGCGVFVNGALVSVLAQTGIHYLLAQVLATVVMLFVNFWISAAWVFKKSERS